MHLHTIMKSGTSGLPCSSVEAHQTQNVQSPVCPTMKCSVYEREKKNTPASQPHGLALLDPHKRERAKERKKKSLAPQEKPQKKGNNGARPKTPIAQPKDRTTNPLPRPNLRGKNQTPRLQLSALLLTTVGLGRRGHGHTLNCLQESQ